MKEIHKQKFRDKFNSLKDKRGAFDAIHSATNPDAWLENKLRDSEAAVEALMFELQSKDLEIQNSPINAARNWADEIEKELKNANITKDGLLEAVVRKVILGDASLADLLSPKLIEINGRKPRP